MRKHTYSFTGVGVSLLAGFLSINNTALAQGGTVSDAQVEANVLRALAGAPQLATQSIKTTTVYGTVTLSGSVSDEESRTLAEKLASKAPGVQKVVDELTLGSDAQATQAPSPDQEAQGQQQGQVLQSDGTYAPAQQQDSGQQPAYQAQNGAQQPLQQQPAQQEAGQQGAPDWGPAGPPPGYSAQGDPSQQQQGYPVQGQGYPQQQPGYPQQQGYPAQQGQGYPQQGYPQQGAAPPVYRQPYGGAPAGYAPGRQPLGAQEAGKSVTIPPGALVRMRLIEGLTSKRLKAGTIFDGTVLNDVIADGEVAIPRGAAVQGVIVESHDSGAVGGKGQLALQLTSVSLSGRNYPIVSDTWTHYGRDKTGQTVGSAIGFGAFGALIGAVAGGGAGAAIGGAAGAAAGVGASAASGRGQVVIPSEAILTFHLTQPAGVVTVSQAEMDRLGYGVQQSNSMLQRRSMPPQGYYGGPQYPGAYPQGGPY